MSKKLYFGSNLKMYKNIKDTVEYLQKLVENTKDISREEIELFIIPSYTTLESATKNVDRAYVKLGAQNMCWEDQGQFTGEISPLMLKEITNTKFGTAEDLDRLLVLAALQLADRLIHGLIMPVSTVTPSA